ncbi:MAG: AbrB/MazE/SpoVT family DNA-binding domain-containing protein [Candidatus Omnitrophica bacterium]|nr:AbrB/MazE/SpoVT family DNA-binding domain-containing protein [Candidatus Omnitrophota bacterium]
MIKRLTPHGNSSALILDKALLELLHITQNTPLEIATDGKNLIISPVIDGASREKQLKDALARVNKKHGKTLKSLAK